MNPQRRNILIIYMVSYFWSFTTLMVMSNLTLYHEHILGVSKMNLGSIQAYATLSMYFTKFFSGVFVDFFRNYKIVIIIGSILSMISRPLFAFTTSPFDISILRSFERFTKGIRGAPTDAFLTINNSQDIVGRAIAFKQAYYTAGAICGSIFAAFFLYLSGNSFSMLYKLSIVPGLIATVCLFFIKPIPFTQVSKKFEWAKIKHLPFVLFLIYFLAYGISAAEPNPTFIGHRFYEYGVSITWLPLVYLLVDLPWFLISLFLSKKLDSKKWKKTLLYALGFLFFSNMCLMSSEALSGFICGAICLGIYIAIKQGIFLTIISKLTDKDIRGTAFAIYYVITGLGLFTSAKLTGYFAHTFNTWSAGFFMQSFVAFILFIIVLFIPKRFLKAVYKS